MKHSNLQIKELLKQSINEIREGGKGSGRPKGKGKPDDDYAPDGKHYNAAVAAGEDDVDEGGGSESVKESESKPMKRFTVKEISKWMKTLEENRYRKIYNADARRVAWFANNKLSEDYDTMPVSMKKKWEPAQYKKERHLAKEFLKSMKERAKKQKEIKEAKIEKLIRSVVKEIRSGKNKKQLKESFASVGGIVTLKPINNPTKSSQPKQSVNEGPAYEYAKHVKNIEKLEDKLRKSVMDFKKLLLKKGLDDEGKSLSSKYVTNVNEFTYWLKKMMSKLM